MEPSYELFDHTADIGLRIRAATMEALIEPAGEAMYAVIGTVVPGADAEPITLELTSAEPAVLLRDYLAELLVLLERDHRRAVAVDVAEFRDGCLSATVETALVDAERSLIDREVKAVTYHQLDICEINGGCEATVIVDI